MRNNTSIILFLKRGAILLLILFVLDWTIGSGLEKLFYMQKHGDDYVSIYLLEKAKEDIIAFGGSRASHHFNATQIEAGTGMSCFNGGRDEMSILYTAATLPIVYSKSSPKIVILEMAPNELWETPKTKEAYERIATVLLPFCHKYPSLLNTIYLAGKQQEQLKIKASYIYPYNSTIGSSIQNAFTKLGHISVKGYEPLDGSIDSTSYKEPMGDWSKGDYLLDPNMVAALNTVIKLTKEHNTRLITIISPLYFRFNFEGNSGYKALKNIMLENKCEFYDFSHDDRFLKNPYLFHDDIHLNDSGATLFDKVIIEILNKNTQHL